MTRLSTPSPRGAVPLFAKYLADGAPDALYSACFGGAVDAWANTRRKKPSGEAFELTMKVLEATPRTKTRPTANGLGMAGLAIAKAAPDNEDDRAWAKAAKPWFRRERLLKVLEGLAMDANASDDVRFSAVFDLTKLGVPGSTFARLSKECAKSGDACGGIVRSAIDDAVKAK